MSIVDSQPSHWECPCGSEPPKRSDDATPVATIVSLREPICPFCGRHFKKEYRRPVIEEAER